MIFYPRPKHVMRLIREAATKDIDAQAWRKRMEKWLSFRDKRDL